MVQKLTPGEQAIYNGKSFVKDVTKSIKNNSYLVHKYSDNTDINFLHEQYGKVAIEGYPFMNMYGRKSNHCILIIDDHGKNIELRWSINRNRVPQKTKFHLRSVV